MKLNKRQLKRIIREEKQKLVNEYGRTSYGNTPVEGFKPLELGGVQDIIDEVYYIMSELSDGSVRLMDPIEYSDLVATMEDLVYDGDRDLEEYLDALTANKQGQYVRIALRPLPSQLSDPSTGRRRY